jgi:hypothetical protein
MSSLLHMALPAPFDWLSLGLLAGPLGLVLMGVGAIVLRLSDPADGELES